GMVASARARSRANPTYICSQRGASALAGGAINALTRPHRVSSGPSVRARCGPEAVQTQPRGAGADPRRRRATNGQRTPQSPAAVNRTRTPIAAPLERADAPRRAPDESYGTEGLTFESSRARSATPTSLDPETHSAGFALLAGQTT